MKLVDIIVVAVIALIIGLALAYIIKAKKSGQKCIGCPYSRACGEQNANGKKTEGSCCCGCGGEKSDKA